MTVPKRKRGRPLGTGRDDSRTLNEMADLILASPGLRPTTAIRRALHAPSEADIRRLQVKWNKDGSALLACRAAIQRARAEVERSRRTAEFRERMREQQDRIAEFVSFTLGGGHPALRAARALQDSPAMRAMRELQDSPAMRAMREFQDSPAMRAIREFQDSPAMRAVREFQDSPAMRAIREFQDSPAMRVGLTRRP